jgi:biotin transporter BioY
LTEPPEITRLRISEGLFSAVSAGFFFLLVGTLFVITPNLFDQLQAFFTDFTLKESIPHLANVFVPVPEHLAQHTVVYAAAGQFSMVWGVFQVIIFALRFVVGSPVSKKAETAGNVVGWLGTAYLIDVLLTSALLTGSKALENWFVFWAALIMLIGVSLIVRAVILAAHLWFLSRFSGKTS